MKALSLWQPWATLIAIGEKRIETRGWSTSYRGPIAIHAAQRWTHEQEATCKSLGPLFHVLMDAGLMRQRVVGYGYRYRFHLPHGAVIAVAEITDVLPTERIVAEKWWTDTKTNSQGVPYWMPARYENYFGNYEPGRFGYLLAHVRRLAQPVPCRGRQQIFNVPEDVERRVRAELLPEATG